DRHQIEDDEPTTVPPPQPVSAAIPTVEAQVAALQTSMTELLDRIDVLNARIAKLESGAPIPAAAPAPVPQPPPRAATPVPQPPPSAAAPHQTPIAAADIADSYQKALMLIGQGKHQEARAAFQQVFDADPTGQLADNALFWIGETYFASGDSSNAIRYYQRVISEYPSENKAPDAMFKLALAYAKTGDLGLARRTLGECIRKYPYSTAAASAKQELQRVQY